MITSVTEVSVFITLLSSSGVSIKLLSIFIRPVGGSIVCVQEKSLRRYISSIVSFISNCLGVGFLSQLHLQLHFLILNPGELFETPPFLPAMVLNTFLIPLFIGKVDFVPKVCESFFLCNVVLTDTGITVFFFSRAIVGFLIVALSGFLMFVMLWI
jgi:hypothetical protein